MPRFTSWEEDILRAIILRLGLILCVGPILAPLRGIAADAETLKSGIDRSTFDTSVKPGDDFFQYVNGTWVKNNPIPAEYSRWGVFYKLRDDNLVALREIVEELGSNDARLDNNARKLRDFYRTAMDEAKVEQQRIAPIGGFLKKIGDAAEADDIARLVGEFHSTGIGSLFHFSVDQDEKMSTRYAVQFWQGGLGLPERDYYLGSSDYSKQIREQYSEHVAKMLQLLGQPEKEAAKSAEGVLRIETALAEASRTPVQLRDRENQYNKKTLAQLAELAPNWNWDAYWKPLEVAGFSDVIVGQPEFLTRVSELMNSTPISDWQAYLRWHLIHSTAPYLSKELETENFRFYSTVLRGVKEMQPRWKRAIQTLDREMGEALGELYVKKRFPPEAKERMDQLVRNLMDAYRERIESRDWMSPETKQAALAKLAAVMPKIGYPRKWRDYSALEIGTESYAQNALRSQAFEVRYQISKLGKPVDRDEWGMTPPTVNAYYNPSLNEIVFPAGILQPPFFDMKADDAVNYGSIGAVIGHEITHGFDDQGSRSDAEGNLKNWWTPEDRARFTAKTDKIVAQYDACVAVDDQHVNGKLTLGENIADLGGVMIAYAAYQKSLGGKPAPVIDGFTGAQRFFIGYAQSWCGATRDPELRVMLRTNPHSPERFRAVVPLSNVQAFYDAFDVKPSDAMYRRPEERVEIW
jgi:putative endopeptidase